MPMSRLSNPRPRLHPYRRRFGLQGLRVTIMSRHLHPTSKAQRDLALRGYLIHDGKVWWIANDDYEQGLEEVFIGEADGTAEDVFQALNSLDWPRVQQYCLMCEDAEAPLGGFCQSCSQVIADEARGEAAFQRMREGL